MKKVLFLFVFVMYLLCCISAGAEGILPSLEATIGKAMPSISEALGRYPDIEEKTEDGSTVETFHHVTEEDFNTFSAYLEKKQATIADYKVENNVMTANIVLGEVSIGFIYDIQSLEAKVTYPQGTYDEHAESAKRHYDETVRLLNEGKSKEALREYQAIPDRDKYMPARQNEQIEQLETAANEAKFAVGNYVKFGHYPQTSEGTDETPIEWRVLARDGKKALLISRYALDCKKYNTEEKDVTWETCSLRPWLNNEFLNKAFTPGEQAAIETTLVDNSQSQGDPGWSTNGGYNTQDKVFLLSYQEASEYFADYEARKCASTDYAIKNNAYTSRSHQVDGRPTCWWWLRSPGSSATCAADVSTGGGLDRDSSVITDSDAVRPALWVNLESGTF